MLRKKAAFSLVELLIATMVFGLAVGTLLLTFVGCLSLNSISRNLTKAMVGVQSKLEEMYRYDFNTVVADYAAGGSVGDSFTIAGWTRPHSGVVSIIDDGTDAAGLTNADLIEITASICWQERGGRIIGEDSNFDGSFDLATEDANSNNRLDSPAQIVTLMALH